MLADAEALRDLVALAQEAKNTEVIAVEGVPDRKWIVNRDGTREVVMVSPTPRKNALCSRADMIAAVLDTTICPAPEVFVSTEGIAVWCDRNKRADRLQLTLARTARFQLLSSLLQPRAFQPKDAVKMLRLELHGGRHQSVIDALSNIDFQRTNSGKTAVSHGKETLGRSVEASIQQADKVPQQFLVETPIWSTQGFTGYGTSIAIGVHLDPEQGTVELRVLSDEIVRATNECVNAVVASLREALPNIPVFMGVA